MSIFGFDNKYGRPIPYVWFIIIAVSLIPYMLFSGVENAFDCKTLDNDVSKAKCNVVMNQIDTIKPITSAGMFGLLLWQLKPYPFSSYKEDNETPTGKDNSSRSPIT
jgi:hypothetical protein